MNDDETDTAPGDGRFERLAANIGDLDSPFYDEERDRDVWNEASAVGFQTLLWGVPMVAAASLWVGRDAAVPYASAMLIPWVLGAAITLVYARRRAVDPGHVEALAAGRIRQAWFAVVMAALSSGYLWAAQEMSRESNLDSFVRGAAQGGAVGFLAVTLGATVLAFREVRRHRGSART